MKKLIALFFTLVLAIAVIPFNSVNAAELADGKYSLPYQVNKAGTTSASISNDYFLKPATLVKKNGTMYVQITLKNSKQFVKFESPSGGNKVISTDAANDRRTVQFNISSVTKAQKVNVRIEIPEEDYYHSYSIEFIWYGDKAKLIESYAKEETKPAAAKPVEPAPVETKPAATVKPAETKPATTKPAETKDTSSKEEVKTETKKEEKTEETNVEQKEEEKKEEASKEEKEDAENKQQEEEKETEEAVVTSEEQQDETSTTAEKVENATTNNASTTTSSNTGWIVGIVVVVLIAAGSFLIFRKPKKA